jgi:hypothetical protein
MAGRKPDYVLKALNKKTDEKVAHAGAAWVNPDGSITLVLDRFVVLPSDPDWVLTLFPT